MSPDRLDQTYGQHRRRLMSLVGATVGQLVSQGLRDKDPTVDRIVHTVSAAQAQTVAMVDAYMALKTGQQPKGLAASDFTTEAIRGVPAAVVYARPWGALGYQLSNGSDWGHASRSAQASAIRSAQTDVQLSQTHAAQAWMANDSVVTGWARVINSGNPCTLCIQASQQTYHTGDLMPIHQHCDCSVAPIMGSSPTGSTRSVSNVTDDSEIGPQFVQDDD